jgi:hypothetical protein
MAADYPAGTNTIRNLEEKFIYFLVVKFEDLTIDVPQKEYFVYRFIVPVTSKRGKKELKKYLEGSKIEECREISDIEYASGLFDHPEYKTSEKTPLQFPLKNIPIYIQSKINRIDFQKDEYKMGSKPIIRDETSAILPDNFTQRRGGNII